MTTACALIIGDEILTGKVQDANSYTLARVLFERGVRLLRIETVSDDIDEIGQTVRKLSGLADYVFTSGGIGPTHDDRTYEAIAKAFDRGLALHAPTLEKLRMDLQQRYPDAVLNDARKRMALLPDPCEIIGVERLWVPVVVVENVHILPGVPSLFSYMINGIKQRFRGEVCERIIIYTRKSEGDIAEDLSRVQHAFPSVAIGSYPEYDKATYKVMVTFEGVDVETVHKAARQVERAIDGFHL